MPIPIDGKKSSFSVQGVMDIQIKNFTKPVTSEEQDIKLQLPRGFVWKLAEAAKVKDNAYQIPCLNFEHYGQNAYYSVVGFKGS
jgi:hypothetical protein